MPARACGVWRHPRKVRDINYIRVYLFAPARTPRQYNRYLSGAQSRRVTYIGTAANKRRL